MAPKLSETTLVLNQSESDVGNGEWGRLVSPNTHPSKRNTGWLSACIPRVFLGLARQSN